MKISASILYRFIFVSIIAAGFAACQKDPHNMLTKKWKMENEEFTLDIRADSSYVVIENQKKPQVGKWRLENDDKIIIFQQKNNPVVNMGIKTLSEEKFVLDNNGEEMNFAASN